MNKHTWIAVWMLACGGSSEPAKSTADCPAGMVRQGGDCVAPAGESGPTTPAADAGAPATTSTSTTSTVPYNQDAVGEVINRATGQVKSNCGSATNSDGKAVGPWGTAKIQVHLGRNGHVHGVDVAERYRDKPTGTCVVNAFKNLIYPPYSAPEEVILDLEVEIIQPPGT